MHYVGKCRKCAAIGLGAKTVWLAKANRNKIQTQYPSNDLIT